MGKQFMLTGVLALSLGLGLSSAQADVRWSSIFCDHAVLQRDLPVPVWGTAEPGEQVTVKVGSAQATTTADAQGKWMLRLPAKGAFVPNRGMALRLGYWEQNRYFKGSLSDFRIYRTPLSPSEVQAVMKEGSVVREDHQIN